LKSGAGWPESCGRVASGGTVTGAGVGGAGGWPLFARVIATAATNPRRGNRRKMNSAGAGPLRAGAEGETCLCGSDIAVRSDNHHLELVVNCVIFSRRAMAPSGDGKHFPR